MNFSPPSSGGHGRSLHLWTAWQLGFIESNAANGMGRLTYRTGEKMATWTFGEMAVAVRYSMELFGIAQTCLPNLTKPAAIADPNEFIIPGRVGQQRCKGKTYKTPWLVQIDNCGSCFFEDITWTLFCACALVLKHPGSSRSRRNRG